MVLPLRNVVLYNVRGYLDICCCRHIQTEKSTDKYQQLDYWFVGFFALIASAEKQIGKIKMHAG